ncbi:MAG: dephospho-CoA kinase [Rhodobacteraceae bacterium]|nr:dephospho-CoA kinase [Paracoccaceae bacterium]
MSFSLGLTGSIGMGKSTTAGFFKDAGCDVWDADAAVHRLYTKQGAAVTPLSNLFPKALIEGAISRQVLKHELQKNPDLIGQLEAIVHPLVAQDRQTFIDSAQSDILVFDIPLLFETGADAHMNAVICVTIDEEEQKKRVLERGTMNEEMFEQIKSRQWSNSQKCEKADFVILTDTLDHVHAQVDNILANLRAVKDA